MLLSEFIKAKLVEFEKKALESSSSEEEVPLSSPEEEVVALSSPEQEIVDVSDAAVFETPPVATVAPTFDLYTGSKSSGGRKSSSKSRKRPAKPISLDDEVPLSPPPKRRRKSRVIGKGPSRSTGTPAASPATEALKSRTPKKAVPDPEKGTEGYRYNKIVATVYKSTKYVGRFNLPVAAFVSADVLPEWATRPLVETHVVDLMKSMSDYNSGVLVRDAFKLLLVSLESTNWSNQRVKKEIDKLCEKHAGDTETLRKKISDYLESSALAGITIGGNHSREAIQRLLKSGSLVFDKNLVVPTDVFYDLTKEEALAIGWVDNMVSSIAAEYTLRDKVALIRDLWKDPKNVTETGLSASAMETATYEYMYTSRKKDDDAKKKKKTLDSSGPFVKACNVPDDLWPLVNNILSRDLLNLTIFRSIQWHVCPKQLKKALLDLLNSRTRMLSVILEMLLLKSKIITKSNLLYLQFGKPSQISKILFQKKKNSFWLTLKTFARWNN